MIIKASGRSALILAAGLLVLLASPVRAAATDGDDSAAESKSENPAAAPATPHRTFRQASHHRRSYAHRKFHPIAIKANADKKPVAMDAATDDGKALADIPPSIANANARMLLAGIQISAAAAIPTGTDISAMASDNPPTTRSDNETILVAADQLNDMDKALHESNPPAPANPPPAPTATMTSENSVWDQTSLIGKVFIGFGALLTMASAARMFMA
jgi:hypothetical protein